MLDAELQAGVDVDADFDYVAEFVDVVVYIVLLCCLDCFKCHLKLNFELRIDSECGCAFDVDVDLEFGLMLKWLCSEFVVEMIRKLC